MAAADRWYTRPVLFVAHITRASDFYTSRLGFTKKWHAADGAGPVCQVDHGECEIILCMDAARAGSGRLYIELTGEAFEDLRRDLAAGGVVTSETHWGYATLVVADPDGNELYFPIPQH